MLLSFYPPMTYLSGHWLLIAVNIASALKGIFYVSTLKTSSFLCVMFDLKHWMIFGYTDIWFLSLCINKFIWVNTIELLLPVAFIELEYV
jgi:hypothetical protein